MPATTSFLIRPLEPSPSFTSWPLTPLDQANFLLVLRGTWLFRETLDPDALRQGLLVLLSGYPQMAARSYRGQRFELHEAGFPLEIESRLDLRLADLTDGRISADRFAIRLRPWKIKRGWQAPIAIRLTRLADGSVLSVSCSHALCDGRTFYTLIHDWAEATAGRPWTPPTLDPSLLPTARKGPKQDAIEEAARLGWSSPSLWKMLQLVPHFLSKGLLERTPPIAVSNEELQELHSLASPASNGLALHTHDLLSAYLSKASSSLVGLPDTTECKQAIVVDLRERIARLPSTFAGNAAFIVRGATFTPKMPFSDLALATHQALAPSLSRPSPALEDHLRLGLELIHHKALWLPYDITAIYSAQPTTFYINNFARLPIYDVNFGTLDRPIRPFRVIPHNLPDPILIWPSPPDIGGFEIYLTGRLAAYAKAKISPNLGLLKALPLSR